MEYIRDPAEIYRQSFQTVRREAELARFGADESELAIRLIHACGMPDVVDDLVVSPAAVDAGRAALAAGNPIICDVRMVEHGIIRRHLRCNNEILCRVDAPDAAAHAQEQYTTRSAAGMDILKSHIPGAIVAIGNAPTALFRLLELLDAGLEPPALIIGIPVGFVGAVESKVELERDPRGCQFITVHGRRGGSALASAAINALSGGLS